MAESYLKAKKPCPNCGTSMSEKIDRTTCCKVVNRMCPKCNYKESETLESREIDDFLD